ncbi:MAG: hypothetical protein WCW27_03075 [Patescibacteria group bacterium]|jgi:antitoxin (DNA-binding transcriptional repressor) of toxin-antitoxin stability system
MTTKQIIYLKKLRENMDTYIQQVQTGQSFVVYRRSEPVFKISPITDELWEEVIDFTKLHKGGVNINELLNRL